MHEWDNYQSYLQQAMLPKTTMTTYCKKGATVCSKSIVLCNPP